METITRSYETFEDARNVVVRLEREGITADRVSLVGRQSTGDDRAVSGAALGGAAGGTAGLLAGLGLVAIPGIGPAVAIGWLASAIVGAGTGALAGGAIGAATETHPELPDAPYYAETVRRGGAVVSVTVDPVLVARVRAIMDEANPIDDVTRRARYESEGWTGARAEHLDRTVS
jgi:hypothetical protein